MSRWAVPGMTGLFCGLLQHGLYARLEGHLTAAWPSYAAVTLGWLLGGLAGLCSEGRPRVTVWLLAGAAAADAICGSLLSAYPARVGFLPVYGLLAAVGGAFASSFLRGWRPLAGSVAHVMLWENNGFILGFTLSMLGGLVWGDAFLDVAPKAAALPLAAVLWRASGSKGS